MKILVGISGASGVELGFCLLKALENFTQKNDEIYGILSKGAGASFWAENLALNSANAYHCEPCENDENVASVCHCERDEVEAWWLGRSGFCVAKMCYEPSGEVKSIENSQNFEFQAKNSAQNSNKNTKNSAFSKKSVENSLNLNLNHSEKAENSKNSSQNSQLLLSNNEILALCKKKFNLKKTHFFDDENLAAAVSSGSFGIDKTIIAPCSLNTLAKIKAGFADTLILRAAAVALKERKTLVLGVREMPFSTLALKQMTRLSKMGVIIAPPVFASYFKAENLDDLRNFIVGKWLDLLGIEHELYKRWR